MRALALALIMTLAACGSPRTITTPDGVREFSTVGLFTNKSRHVCYEVSVGNVIWSILLIETIVAPVYFVGWSLWNPIRAKTSPDDDCAA